MKIQISRAIRWLGDHERTTWIMLAVLVSMVYYVVNCGAVEIYDTVSYRVAGVNLLGGEVDSFRTPVYPLILSFADLFGPLSGLVMWMIQTALYALSVPYLLSLSRRMLPGKTLVRIVVGFYVFYPCFGMLTATLITESLSVSLMMIMAESLVRLGHDPRWRRVWSMAAMLVVMLMLRPAFQTVTVALVLLALGGLVSKRHRRQGVMTGVIALVGLTTTATYNRIVYNVHGITSGSVVTSINTVVFAQLHQRLDTKLWDEIHRPLVDSMNNHQYTTYKRYGRFYEIRIEYGPRRYEEIARATVKGQELALLKAKFNDLISAMRFNALFVPYNCEPVGSLFDDSTARRRLQNVLAEPRDTYKYNVYTINQELLQKFNHAINIPLSLILWMLTGWGLMFVVRVVRRRGLSGTRVWLWLLTTGALMSSVLIGYGDYARLFVEAMPLAMLMMVMTLSWLVPGRRGDTAPGRRRLINPAWIGGWVVTCVIAFVVSPHAGHETYLQITDLTGNIVWIPPITPKIDYVLFIIAVPLWMLIAFEVSVAVYYVRRWRTCRPDTGMIIAWAVIVVWLIGVALWPTPVYSRYMLPTLIPTAYIIWRMSRP